MSNSHDLLFKWVFEHPEHAAGALRSVMPAALTRALDWSTLARYPGSFVDRALTERHTDLLFSIAWRDGGQALVYLLFEHQSTPDDQMPFRLLRYLVRIWERWCKEHPGAGLLPVILPIVLYHDDEPWSAPMAFDTMFDIPDAVRPALAPYLVKLTYFVDDLSETPDEELRARAMTALGRLVELCFKHGRTRSDLLDKLISWADLVFEVFRARNGLEALEVVMRYILDVNDHVEPKELQAFLVRVAGSDAKDIVMTAGQRLREEGEQRGIQKGKSSLLLHQLRQRFGNQVGADIERHIATASAEQLDLWGTRILSAETIADLLAE